MLKTGSVKLIEIILKKLEKLKFIKRDHARLNLYFFHHDEGLFDYLSIHTNKLFLDNKEISLMN